MPGDHLPYTAGSFLHLLSTLTITLRRFQEGVSTVTSQEPAVVLNNTSRLELCLSGHLYPHFCSLSKFFNLVLLLLLLFFPLEKWRCQLVPLPHSFIHLFTHSALIMWLPFGTLPCVKFSIFSPGNSRKERQLSKPRSFWCSINKTQVSFFLPFLLLFQVLLPLAGHTEPGSFGG